MYHDIFHGCFTEKMEVVRFFAVILPKYAGMVRTDMKRTKPKMTHEPCSSLYDIILFAMYLNTIGSKHLPMQWWCHLPINTTMF